MCEICGICLFLVTLLNHEPESSSQIASVAYACAQLKTLSSLLKMCGGLHVTKFYKTSGF